MSGKRNRLHDEEEHENHERWLVTYADMVTLLMVLFIVMFAMSSVDAEKFKALKSGLASGFGQSTSVLSGSTSLLEESGTSTVQPIGPTAPETTVQVGADKTVAETAADNAANRRKAASEVDRLDKVKKALLDALKAKGLQDDVQASYDERGLVLSLVSKHVVFENNLASLSPRGQQVVDTIGPVLATLPEQLEISGNTNQAAGPPKFYPTDWDLSAARALSVLRRLNEQLGVPTDRLTMTAFGHTRPLKDPSKPGAQAINKRVDIVVLSPTEADTREQLSKAATDQKARHAAASPTAPTAPSAPTDTAGTDGSENATAGGSEITHTTDHTTDHTNGETS